MKLSARNRRTGTVRTVEPPRLWIGAGQPSFTAVPEALTISILSPTDS